MVAGRQLAWLRACLGRCNVLRGQCRDPGGGGGRQPRGVAEPDGVAATSRHRRSGPRAGRCIWAVRCGGPTAAAPGVGQGGASALSAAARRRIDGYPASRPGAGNRKTTTSEDLVRLVGNAADGLDVLICHDAPDRTPGLISGLPWQMPPHLRTEADTVQALLRAAVDATEPELVFHGHWHQHNRRRLNNASEVVGLAADGHPQSAAVVTNPTLTDPTHRPPPAARASRPEPHRVLRRLRPLRGWSHDRAATPGEVPG